MGFSKGTRHLKQRKMGYYELKPAPEIHNNTTKAFPTHEHYCCHYSLYI